MTDKTQTSLGAFQSDTETSTTSRDTELNAVADTTRANSSPSTSDDSKGSTASADSPLKGFYETIRDSFDEQYPDALRYLDTVVPITPQRDVFVTSDLPKDLPVAPTRIGSWELDYHDESMVTYRMSGRVFDERFGDGGAIIRHQVYFNDRGANADDTWKHVVESCTGFGNPDQVRTAMTSDSDNLHGIRGHNVRENSGDRGTWSGTKASYGTATEAVAAVVAQLHAEPQPLHHNIPPGDGIDWRVVRYGLRSASWEQPAPTTTAYDTVRLEVNTTHARLRCYEEGTPLPDHDRFSLPIPDDLPNTCATQIDPRTEISALAVVPHFATATLHQSPQALLEAVHA